MGLLNWLALFFTGGISRMEAQAAAQPSEPLPLPMTVTIGESEVTLRRLESSDRAAVLAFARALPEEDLLFLRRDITQVAEVDAWLRANAEGVSQTVLALSGGDVVGYAAVVSEGVTWTRHVAELRVLIAPAMRGQGLGRLLTAQAFALAKRQGVRKMLAQMTTDQQAARHVFERMGFASEAVLRGQVMDREGTLRDLRIMSIDVEKFERSLDAARAQAESASLSASLLP